MRSRVVIIACSLLVLGLLGGDFALRKIQGLQDDNAFDDALYVSSPQVLQKLSLGYSGLLADIYWTRVVQYFGTKHAANSREYKSLAPLLDIATTLDPSLTGAYEFGSIFLAQRPPEGAGDPDAAIALVERGIRNNPDNWRLYYTLGYFEYLEKKDYAAAAKAFEEGSQKPGAQIWMKVMAALMMGDAGSIQTARYMWSRIYEESQTNDVKQNALTHLVSLKADEDMQQLETLATKYKQQAGEWPSNWHSLIAAGMLRSVPVDPHGVPYRLKPQGKVEVADPQNFRFLHSGAPAGP
ncbi:MAG TPA: hypothetical protein VFZ99_03540 [Terriglobales bacterium]